MGEYQLLFENNFLLEPSAALDNKQRICRLGTQVIESRKRVARQRHSCFEQRVLKYRQPEDVHNTATRFLIRDKQDQKCMVDKK